MKQLSTLSSFVSVKVLTILLVLSVALVGLGPVATAQAEELTQQPADPTTEHIEDIAESGGIYTEQVGGADETPVLVEFDYSAETMTVSEDSGDGEVIVSVTFDELAEEMTAITEEYLNTPEGLAAAEDAGLDNVVLDGQTVASETQQLSKRETCRLLTRYVGLVHGGAWGVALKLVSAHPAIRIVTTLGNAALFWYVRRRC